MVSIKDLSDDVREQVLNDHRYIRLEDGWTGLSDYLFEKEFLEYGIKIDTPFIWELDSVYLDWEEPAKIRVVDINQLFKTVKIDRRKWEAKFLIKEHGKENPLIFARNYLDLPQDRVIIFTHFFYTREFHSPVFYDFIKKLNHWWLKKMKELAQKVRAEYEWETSDEAIMQHLEAFEFSPAGKVIS